MPTAMTFNSLQADLQSYLERGSPADVEVFNQIPRLINLAERALARALKIQGFLTPAISTLVAGTPVYAKPDRWRRTVSMNYGAGSGSVVLLLTEAGVYIDTESASRIRDENVGITENTRQPIFARSYEYCRTYWPDQTQTAPPMFYADYDYLHWLVVPTPDINYPWEVNYYSLPPLLDSTNQTNWLTDFAPNALLYRALLEATPFLKNDERIQVWQQFYQEEISALGTEDLQRAADRAAKRNED